MPPYEFNRTRKLEQDLAIERAANVVLTEQLEAAVRLINELNDAVDDERRRIANDIHDELNSSVIAARLSTEAIINLAGNQELDRTRIMDSAVRIKTILDDLYRAARTIVKRPGSDILDSIGLYGALSKLTEDIRQSESCNVQLHCDDNLTSVPSAVCLVAYRVVQEALNNTQKHSKAANASVTVEILTTSEIGSKVLHIEIADDGVGFDTHTKQGGLGLIGMRGRTLRARGLFAVESDQGNGTRIVVDLPIDVES